MLRLFLVLGLLAGTASGQGSVSGSGLLAGASQFGLNATLTLSALSLSPSANTIVATWTSSAAANSTMLCGTSPGSYTLPAVENGSPYALSSTTSHEQICANLTPSTTYYVEVISSVNGAYGVSTASAATTALASTTPITGASVGTMTYYNDVNANNQGCGDTFYNAKSSNGVLYMTHQDTSCNFTVSGSPAYTISSAIALLNFVSETPGSPVIQTINTILGYGRCCAPTDTDGKVTKSSGLFAINGHLIMSLARTCEATFTGCVVGVGNEPQGHGQFMADNGDHGATWNTFQTPSVYNAAGVPTGPAWATMFPQQYPSTVTMAFVMPGAADDGTLGYLTTNNRVNDMDAYVYGITNEGSWDGGGTTGVGNAFYLARVPRADILNLNPADWQWYTGGDGNLNSNWTNNQKNATTIISASGECGNPSIQYLPSLNRYILLTFYYPNGDGGTTFPSPNTANSEWVVWESPTPWGPWTNVQQFNWPTDGWYNPIIQTDTAYSGTTPTIWFSRNYGAQDGGVAEGIFFATLTITH